MEYRLRDLLFVLEIIATHDNLWIDAFTVEILVGGKCRVELITQMNLTRFYRRCGGKLIFMISDKPPWRYY